MGGTDLLQYVSTAEKKRGVGQKEKREGEEGGRGESEKRRGEEINFFSKIDLWRTFTVGCKAAGKGALYC